MIESSLKQAGRDADSDPGDWPPAAAADHIGTHDRIRRADRDGLTIALATTDSSARAAGHEPGRPAVLVRFSTAANAFPFRLAGTPTGAASRGASPASVPGVEFSRELRNDVLAGDITLSVRLWKRPQVKQGGPPRSSEIEVDAIELVPFAAVTGEDVRRASEPDRETLRQRAAHAGPIDEDTLVYLIEFHAVSPAD